MNRGFNEKTINILYKNLSMVGLKTFIDDVDDLSDDTLHDFNAGIKATSQKLWSSDEEALIKLFDAYKDVDGVVETLCCLKSWQKFYLAGCTNRIRKRRFKEISLGCIETCVFAYIMSFIFVMDTVFDYDNDKLAKIVKTFNENLKNSTTKRKTKVIITHTPESISEVLDDSITVDPKEFIFEV